VARRVLAELARLRGFDPLQGYFRLVGGW
jgi:hypothetical protein